MNKISILVLTIDEALKNAQKTLFERLKVVKIEHIAIQHLINQVERTRVELDLTDKASIIIDQMHANNDFQFASIDLTKKASKTTSTSYKDTLSENFQKLEKAIRIKLTKLINQQFESQSSRLHVNKTETSKLANAKKTDESKTSQTIRKTQTSENSRLNNVFSTNSSSST